jgi:uncharacterized protein YidB (DUF937 family)
VGLLDQLLRSAIGNSRGDAADNPMLEAVLGLVNNSQSGGLGGLIQSLREKGFGEIAASWIATGRNLPISAEQLSSVLGSEQVEQLAQQFGLSHGEVASNLAELLPQVVDKLTPGGELPDAGALAGMLDAFRKLG